MQGITETDKPSSSTAATKEDKVSVRMSQQPEEKKSPLVKNTHKKTQETIVEGN